MLGQGGFGITYEGIQTGLNRRVAIKEFFMRDYCDRDSSGLQVTDVGTVGTLSMVALFREKFVKEAQLIASMSNAPHVVRIYDIFQENGTAYYVMEYIEGGSLQQLVKQQGTLNEKRTLQLIRQTAEALSALHQKQTMHLDVKPANILLRKDQNGNDDVVLIDFGVSKHYDGQGHQTTTTPVGFSKGYAPIEQYREGGVGQFSPASDVYSLGATLYYLLTATTPPEASDLLEEPIQQPKGITNATWKVISRAMQATRKNRYQAMEEMMVDLKAAQAAALIASAPKPQATIVRPKPQETEGCPKPQETVVAPKPQETVVSPKPRPAAASPRPQTPKPQAPKPPIGRKPMPPMPKRKKRLIWPWIVGGILLIPVVLGVLVGLWFYLHRTVYCTVDRVEYELSMWDKTAELRKGDQSVIGTVRIPSIIQYGGTSFTVTKIGSFAFQEYEMTAVYIPGSVKELDYGAFDRCHNLKEAYLEEGIEKFGQQVFSNTGLTSIVLPSTIKELGYCDFENCPDLMIVVCNATTPPFSYYDDIFGYGDDVSRMTLYVPTSAVSTYSNISPWGNFGQIIGN